MYTLPLMAVIGPMKLQRLSIKNVMPRSATKFGFFVSDGISETNLTLNYSVLLIQMGGGTA